MKKHVLTYGLLSGAIFTLVMVVSTAMCYKDPDFKGNMILGYASMLVAFSFIFVGITKERKLNGGTISFGKAFMTGLYITLIASTMYVLVWLVEFYLFIPDFMEKYSAHVIKEATDEGVTGAALQSKIDEMDKYKEYYKNPVFVILLTYMEVLPLGLIVNLIAALILKKKPTPENQVA